MTEESRHEWEYHVETIPVEQLDLRRSRRRIEDRLNELGRDGWELVGGQLGADHIVYTLKRRRIDS